MSHKNLVRLDTHRPSGIRIQQVDDFVSKTRQEAEEAQRIIDEIFEYYEDLGVWPSLSHPTLGTSVTYLKNQFRNVANNRPLNLSRGFTTTQFQKLRGAGFNTAKAVSSGRLGNGICGQIDKLMQEGKEIPPEMIAKLRSYNSQAAGAGHIFRIRLSRYGIQL